MIFLHRQYSLQPFARHYRHTDELILDIFELAQGDNDDELVVKMPYRKQIRSDILSHHKVIENLPSYLNFL